MKELEKIFDKNSECRLRNLTGLCLPIEIKPFFIVVLGDYISSIHTQVRNMPLVLEMERVNF